MSKVAVGSIPEKITYVFSNEKDVNVGCRWDISYSPDQIQNLITKKVLPTYPVDSSDEKSKAKAIAWATKGTFNFKTNSYEKSDFKIEEVINNPIKEIKVLSLEERGQGGRAYKAIINNYYVDLREDVLMDTILKVGIDAGGVLKGEYVWAKMGSQMKLVRVGSELYKLIVEFESKKDIKPIDKGDLEVGGIYQDRKKNKAIFIGYVNTVNFANENVHEYYPERFGKAYKATFDFKKTSIKKACLFLNIFDFQSNDEVFDGINDIRKYYFKIKKTHSYIEKIDQRKIPDDLINKIRIDTRNELKQNILEYTGRIPPKANVMKMTDRDLENNIIYDSPYLNLFPYGTNVDVFDIKKFLLFS